MNIVLKSINCDLGVETREYKKFQEIVNHIDTIDENEVWTSPMLDDEIVSLTVDEKQIDITEFKIVNDLYLFLK